MNILPKKKWHVRTKENVARVRRDQKKANEEEKRIAERFQLAEQEYKVNLLRQNAQRMETMYSSKKSEVDDNNVQLSNSSGHINFFADLETEHRKNFGIGNRDYELEKKKEQEEYEKKVGILQYLGQGSSELTKEKPWYEKVPTKKKTESIKSEIPVKEESNFGKSEIRPTIVKKLSKRDEHKKKYKNKKSHHKERRKKSKHRGRSSSEMSSNDEKASDFEEIAKKQKLEKLRQERLDREAKERKRLNTLLALSESNKAEKEQNVAKYNSQFNPALARQNKSIKLQYK